MDKNILFINNAGGFSFIPKLLMANGYGVDIASDQEAGLRLLDEHGYHLAIVMDRPVAESWRLCEKIQRLTGIPLIVISTDANTETCVKAINAGADYFMRKPCGPLELLARIDSLLQRTLPRLTVPVVSE